MHNKTIIIIILTSLFELGLLDLNEEFASAGHGDLDDSTPVHLECGGLDGLQGNL